MDENVADLAKHELMPADKAALRSFRLAFLALAVGGLTLWLANFFGAMACNIGFVVWLLCLIPSVAMAISALRSAVFSDTPRIVRRQALVSLVMSGVNLVLGLAFIWAIMQAVQKS